MFPDIVAEADSFIFQQDRAPPHFDAIVCRDGPIGRPSLNPDLTPMDYFFWEYIRDMMHSKILASLLHLH
jgi:hypothetical protein